MVRRTFLVIAGAIGLAFPAVICTRAAPPAKKREPHMEIKRNGSQPSGKGPAEYFTGSVRVDPILNPPDPARVAIAHVTFEPGARTAWHTHPLGQTLLVTGGSGWVQRDGGPIEK